MNTNTRNINEAIAQANRRERAEKIIQEGYSFTKDADSGMVAVCKPGDLHASYWIGEHVDGSTGCDCPDRVKTGKPCKHEIANNILESEKTEFEAMAERWEEEEDNRRFMEECAIEASIRF